MRKALPRDKDKKSIIPTDPITPDQLEWWIIIINTGLGILHSYLNVCYIDLSIVPNTKYMLLYLKKLRLL